MCTKIENENTITLMRNGTNKKEYDLEDLATKSCSQNYMYVQSRACFASADQASACRWSLSRLLYLWPYKRIEQSRQRKSSEYEPPVRHTLKRKDPDARMMYFPCTCSHFGS